MSMNIVVELDQYTGHVVLGLRDIKGRDPKEVVAYILRQWIGEHLAELNAYGLGPSDWTPIKHRWPRPEDEKQRLLKELEPYLSVSFRCGKAF